MKIVHYHREILLEKGGVVRAVLDICSGLAAAGEEVVLLSPELKDAPAEWRNGAAGHPRAIPTPAPGLGGILSRAALAALRAELRGADVLHLHGMWGLFNVQIARLARSLGVPYVYSVHGMLDDWCMAQRGPKKRLYLALCGRRTLHEAAAVHCTAEHELAQSRKWFPRGRGVVVPLILDVAPFAELPGPAAARARLPELGDGRPTLLFLSRLHYKKGVEHLLRAAARLRDGGRDLRVVVAGTGDEAYAAALRRLAAELRLGDAALFPGFVSGVEKVSLFEAADLFVLPTSQENFGFVIFEAMAARTPVVTTRGADTWPEVESSGGGVVSATDPVALAETIATLLDDPERRRRMGEAGRAWVLGHLAPEAVVAEFQSLYASAREPR